MAGGSRIRHEDMKADYGDYVSVTLSDGAVFRGILADIDLDPDEPGNDRISIDAHPTVEILLSDVATIS